MTETQNGKPVEAWIVRTALISFTVLMGWLSTQVLEIKESRFTKQDGRDLRLEITALRTDISLIRSTPQREVLDRFARLDQRIDRLEGKLDDLIVSINAMTRSTK